MGLFTPGCSPGGGWKTARGLKGACVTASGVYWITSSALSSTVCGTVTPRAWVVFRLITSSNCVGWLTASGGGHGDLADVGGQAGGRPCACSRHSSSGRPRPRTAQAVEGRPVLRRHRHDPPRRATKNGSSGNTTTPDARWPTPGLERGRQRDVHGSPSPASTFTSCRFRRCHRAQRLATCADAPRCHCQPGNRHRGRLGQHTGKQLQHLGHEVLPATRPLRHPAWASRRQSCWFTGSATGGRHDDRCGAGRRAECLARHPWWACRWR